MVKKASLMNRLSRRITFSPLFYNLFQKLLTGDYLIKTKGIFQEEGFLDISCPILDIGCGTGIFSGFFENDCYIGLDFNQRSINYAQKRTLGKYVVADAKTLPFKKSLFKRILSIGLLHHLSDTEVMRVMKECHYIIHDDGKVLIIDAIFSKNKSKFIGNLFRKLDAGANIRDIVEYRNLLSEIFLIEKEMILESSIVDCCVFVLKK